MRPQNGQGCWGLRSRGQGCCRCSVLRREGLGEELSAGWSPRDSGGAGRSDPGERMLRTERLFRKKGKSGVCFDRCIQAKGSQPWP